MNIISIYILSEFFPHFILSFVVFMFILVMDKLFALTNLIINKGVDSLTVIKLFLYTIPSFATLTFPMAFLMATLLTFGRMQEDNEITALRAAGVPQVRVVLPLIVLGIIASIGLAYFNQEIAPRTQKKFAETYYKIAYQRPTLNIEENAFTEIEHYRLFVRKIHRITNTLEDIIIYKLDPKTYPLLITAQKGKLKKIDDYLVLELKNGIIQRKDDTEASKFNLITFKKYLFTFNLQETISQTQDFTKSIVNMTGKELKSEILKLKQEKISPSRVQTQYNQRNTIAWACFTFVLLAGPLAIMAPRHNKAISFGMSIVLIFVFYVLLATAMSISDRGIIPSTYALLLPNIITGSIGVFLMFKLTRR